MSFSLGATAAVDADSTSGGAGTGIFDGMVYRNRQKNSVSSGSVILAKYREAGVAGTVTFQYRWIKVTPIRII